MHNQSRGVRGVIAPECAIFLLSPYGPEPFSLFHSTFKDGQLTGQGQVKELESAIPAVPFSSVREEVSGTGSKTPAVIKALFNNPRLSCGLVDKFQQWRDDPPHVQKNCSGPAHHWLG